MNNETMSVRVNALAKEVARFFRPDEGVKIYDCPSFDAWAVAQGFFIDRETHRKADGDYDCFVVCRWHEGYTFRVAVDVVSYVKQRAACQARREKEVA